MKWIEDKSKRYKKQPYYNKEEIDSQCDSMIRDFLKAKFGDIKFPISTDDLTLLVEENVESFDLYADLQKEGRNVEGVTIFQEFGKPIVNISSELSKHHYHENRLRSTLMHELGHVVLHRNLEPINNQSKVICKRENIISAKKINWIEWQASYASGAFLMPILEVEKLVNKVHELLKSDKPLDFESNNGFVLIGRIQGHFEVSRQAAEVRLKQLKYLI